MHLVGCLYNCIRDARSYKHQIDTVSFGSLVYMCVLEEGGAFILRVEESLKMKAESSSDMLVLVYQNKYYHIPENSNI